jgi:hypothetical protein
MKNSFFKRMLEIISLSLFLLEFSVSLKVASLTKVQSITSINSKSFLYLKSLECTDNCCQTNNIADSINGMPNFDNSISIEGFESVSMIDAILKEIVPSSLLQIENFRNDLRETIMATASLADNADISFAYRLALMSGVRCPKWHEDYVKLRLIKTYYGEGTEWVDPSDLGIRAMTYMDWDMNVKDRSKVRRAGVNDLLIISGRERKEKWLIPVLHRSPSVNEIERRLLLTITVS